MVSEVKRRAGQALADKKKMENAAREEAVSLAESLERARNLLVPHLQGVLQEK